MKHILYIGLFFLYSCANVVAPSGGIKDTLPPKVVEMTPKNKSISFDENDITIVFDELIQINDKQSLYLSPYSQDIVNLSINKNKLKISFKDKLAENTTYYLNLNNLIKDVNEGNPLDQLDYLFSTGKEIDSLSLNGYVIDAISSEPMNDIWVGLYSKETDSLLYKQTPLYVVKSINTGMFTFSNLPKDSFVVYAIEDLDNNLRFTIPNEKVGFYPNKVKSQSTDINIRLFDETALVDTVKPLVHDSTILAYGKLIIDSLPQSTALIVELLQKETIILRKQASFPTVIDSLPAGKYLLRIIEDSNRNGIWDSGNLTKKYQPEKVILYPKDIIIRDNWDVLIEWDTN